MCHQKDQAKIIWLEAKRMVRNHRHCEKRMKTLVAEINSDFNDFFRPLGRDSDSLDGLNVHGALLDEIHAWKDINLYDVIRMVRLQGKSLWFYHDNSREQLGKAYLI